MARYEILPPVGAPSSDKPRYEILPPKEEEETGRNRDQIYDDTFFGELGEGIVSGGIGIVEGVIGAGALLTDLSTGENSSDAVTKKAEEIRDSLGLDPEGFVGKGAEILTQYAIPGMGAASVAGKLAMAGRAAKAAKAGKALGPMSKAERFGLAAPYKEFCFQP